MTEMYAQIPVEDPAAATAAGSVSQVTEQLASLTTADESSSSQQHQLQQTVEEEDHECSDEYYCDEDDGENKEALVAGTVGPQFSVFLLQYLQQTCGPKRKSKTSNLPSKAKAAIPY